MKAEELNEILKKHQKWLKHEEGGECARFNGINLKGVDLSETVLKYADFVNADLRYTNFSGADLRYTNLAGANLTGANLTKADLKGAIIRDTILKDANLDYSCLPLWCGSLEANFDEKQIIQFLYHVIRAGLQSSYVGTKVKKKLSKLIEIANRFHRADECGKIKRKS